MTSRAKPAGLTRLILKAPVYLYRARLGFLFGSRFLMLEHRGRRSGALYRTVLEVVDSDRGRHDYMVVAGWGPKSDWYRNLEAGGLVAVWIGSTRRQATVRFLEPVEAAEVFAGYEKAHPRAARILMEKLDLSHDGTEEGRIDLARQIPVVSLTAGGF